MTADIELVQKVLAGDREARTKVTGIVHPIITFQSDRFCKRFCKENRYRYVCTLPKPWGTAERDALLCEWGNACYGWMLEDLTSNKRLEKFDGRNASSLYNYLFSIANSRPFYERWKDWRFGRKYYVPEYVKAISEHAAKVFLGLKDGLDVELIAQQLNVDEEEADRVAQDIIIELTRRGKLNMLEPEKTVSLNALQDERDDSTSSSAFEIPVNDPEPETVEYAARIKTAWSRLSGIEQYILEALLVDEQDANDVLYALKKLNVRLNEKQASAEIDRQQLYYFRRKTLAKLSRLAGIN